MKDDDIAKDDLEMFVGLSKVTRQVASKKSDKNKNMDHLVILQTLMVSMKSPRVPSGN